MKRSLDAVEHFAVDLVRLQAGWAITTLVLAIQVVAVVFFSAAAPEIKTLDQQAAWESEVLRWLLIPGIVCLYLKACLYLWRSTAPKGNALHAQSVPRTYSQAAGATIVVLSIDNAILLLVPLAFGFGDYLSVLERGVQIFAFVSSGTAVAGLLFIKLAPRQPLFAPIYFAWMLLLEYAQVWLSREHPELPLFNDLFAWNRIFPSLATQTTTLKLDSFQIYELLFASAITVAVALALITAVHGKIKSAASGS
ncbi:MAG: hypothetical protein HRF49_06610 [bacterium]